MKNIICYGQTRPHTNTKTHTFWNGLGCNRTHSYFAQIPLAASSAWRETERTITITHKLSTSRMKHLSQ